MKNSISLIFLCFCLIGLYGQEKVVWVESSSNAQDPVNNWYLDGKKLSVLSESLERDFVVPNGSTWVLDKDFSCNRLVLGDNVNVVANGFKIEISEDFSVGRHVELNNVSVIYLQGNVSITCNSVIRTDLIIQDSELTLKGNIEGIDNLIAQNSTIVSNGYFLQGEKAELKGVNTEDIKLYFDEINKRSTHGAIEELPKMDVPELDTCGSGATEFNIALDVITDYNGMDVSCNGELDAEICVTINGPDTYTVTWLGGPPVGNVTCLPNVGAGNYGVIVQNTSGDNCIANIEVSEPVKLDVLTLVGGTDPSCDYNCDGTSGTVVIIGGTSPYSYDWSTGETTSTASMLCTGTNNIVITDMNGCTDSMDLVINTPLPVDPALTVTQVVSCAGVCDGEITSIPTGGNGAPYTYLWGAGETTDVITGQCAGEITIEVQDNNGCIGRDTLQLTEPTVLSANAIDPNDPTCELICNGTIDSEVLGGTAPFTYSWVDVANGPTGITTQNASGLCDGDFYVVITDVNGCSDQSPNITLNPAPSFTANLSVTQITCFGQNDGAASVTVSGGSGGNTYNWVNTDLGVSIGAGSSVTSLIPGNYEITVTDDQACTTPTYTFTITEPSELFANGNVTQVSCPAVCDGNILLNASGGNPGYSYTWNPVPPSNPTPNEGDLLCAGSYDIQIEDLNGCIKDTTITITEPPVLTAVLTKTDMVCNGPCDGTITSVVTGGTAPYTYAWNPGVPTEPTPGEAADLCAGTYDLTVTDANGCDITESATIIEPPLLTVSAVVVQDVFCNGGCDGTATSTVSNNQGSVTYSWNTLPVQSVPTAVGLCAGNYTVTVTDASGCSNTDNITIAEPAAVDYTMSAMSIDCNGNATGSATITVNSGGTTPFTYLWNDPIGQTTPTAFGLNAGWYIVQMTDGNNCTTIDSIEVTEPTPLDVTMASTNTTCFGTCAGDGTATVSGGTAPYSYTWMETPGILIGQTTSSATGLCAGEYFVQISDDNGCMLTSPSFTVVETPEISALETMTDPSCATADGAIDIIVAGGSGTYVGYNWTPAPGAGQGTSSISSLSPGVYAVTVTDSDGCTETFNYTLAANANTNLSVSNSDLLCNGDNNATASATYTCDFAPCTVSWYDQVTASLLGTGDNISNLSGGDYVAIIENDQGCTQSAMFTVDEPDVIDINFAPTNPTCATFPDGQIDATVTGGTGPFVYTWIPTPGGGQFTSTATALPAGVYYLSVIDQNNCTALDSVELVDNVVLDLSSISATDVSCSGANDGAVSVFPSGGATPYTIQWIDCNTGTTAGTGNVLNGLSGGQYFALVMDAAGCMESTLCQTVNEPTAINAALNLTNPSCSDICNGSIVAVASGGDGTYFYQWLDDTNTPIPGQNSLALVNLCEGTYSVAIADASGCNSVVGPIAVTPKNPWDVTMVTNDVTCDGVCDGGAQVTVNLGNTPPYFYAWTDSNSTTLPVVAGLCEGFYDITITDANGCDTTMRAQIDIGNPIYANLAVSTIDCFGDDNGSITASPIGGTAPYTWTWSTGSTDTTIAPLTPGVYQFSMIDDNGCQKDTSVNLLEPNELLVNATSNSSSCSASNGSITLAITGGTTPYSTNWTSPPITGNTSNFVGGLAAGYYEADITDANGCQQTVGYVISDVDGEDLTVTGTDASCFGVCDGTASVSFTCSDGPCNTPEWTNLTTQTIEGTGTSISNLCAGGYAVSVTNAGGCVSVDTITLNEPTEILDNAVVTPVVCSGTATGDITVAPSGGSGTGYAFNWSPVPPNGQGNNSASTLVAGTYGLSITDGDGCSSSFTYDVITQDSLNVDSIVSPISCFNSCNGVLTATITGGALPYEFSWTTNGIANPADTNVTLSNICAGSYNVSVTDANGCSDTLETPIVLTEPADLVATSTSNSVSCFGECTGEADASAVGGTAPYQFAWYTSMDTPIGTGDTLLNLCPDDIYVVVVDTNGCADTSATITLVENPEILLSTTITDATCGNSCNGSILANVSGGTVATDYVYNWEDFVGGSVANTGNSAINLCAGSYFIEVFDDYGCTAGRQQADVAGGVALDGMIASNNSNCGAADGNATFTPTSGTSPFTYQWLDAAIAPMGGETDSILANATSGIYYINVTDGAGCLEMFPITISDFTPGSVVLDSIQNVSCFNACDGAIYVSPDVTSPVLTYLWNPGGYIQEDLTGQCAGDYVLQITDPSNCIGFYNYSITEPSEMTLSFTDTLASCGACDGSLEVAVSGATGSTLSYLWTNGDTLGFADSLCPGLHEVEVTDSIGCVARAMYQISTVNGPDSLNVVSASATCFNVCDGQADIVHFGTDSITVRWAHDGDTLFNRNDLCAGTFYAEISDLSGCTTIEQITINEPTGIDINTYLYPSTCGNADGGITAMVNGGTSPYTYLWSTAAATQGLTSIAAGLYSVAVTDAMGCIDSALVALSDDSPLTLDVTAIEDSCYGDCSATATAVAANETGAVAYSWTDFDGNVLSATAVVNNLCEGTYYVNALDGANCARNAVVSIESPDSIMMNAPVRTQPSCYGLCDGELFTSFVGGYLPYSYTWSDTNFTSTSNVDNVCAGTYDVIVTDSVGCVRTFSVVMPQPDTLQVVQDSIVLATCTNTFDGSAYLSPSGGTAVYDFVWLSGTDTVATSDDYINALAGTYTVVLTDASNCSSASAVTISAQNPLEAVLPDTSVLCNNTTAVLSVAITGTADTIYWFDNGTLIAQDTTAITITPTTGTIAVYVSDTSCTSTDTATVITMPQVLADAGPDQEINIGNSGQIGGNPTANDSTIIAWSPTLYLSDSTVENPQVILPQNDMYYYLTVTDTMGCVGLDSVFVRVLPVLDITNGFSPDGDGKNETWILPFSGDFPNIEVEVFNRWGTPIFYSQGYGTPWDGRYNGKLVDVGTYYYVIRLNDPAYPEVYSGPLTIMY